MHLFTPQCLQQSALGTTKPGTHISVWVSHVSSCTQTLEPSPPKSRKQDRKKTNRDLRLHRSTGCGFPSWTRDLLQSQSKTGQIPETNGLGEQAAHKATPFFCAGMGTGLVQALPAALAAEGNPQVLI